MIRRKFFGALAGLLWAGALSHGPLTNDASAAQTPWDAIPVELVIDDEVVEIDDPYCPTCYDDPTKLVADTEAEATLTLDCDELEAEMTNGVVFIEVELDDGKTVRIHRQRGEELCADPSDPTRSISLYSGPDWTWDSVIGATIAVVGDS